MELFYTQQIENNRVFIVSDEALHCTKVLRKRVGDEIFVIDGVGGLYRCNIASVPDIKGRLRVENLVVEAIIVERLKGQGECAYNLTMAVCPTKNIDRYEWFVEKATEIGVSKIVPIISSHSIRTSIKRERLQNVALAATKQSLKAYLPIIEESMSVEDFVVQLSNEEEPYDLLLMAHCYEGDKISIRQCMRNLGSNSGKKSKIAILIGPEGDFTKHEIELAQKAGFKPITLGDSRLRVETAALVAVSEIYFGFIC